MNHNPDDTAGYASPPCFAHELGYGGSGCSPVETDKKADVARWRQAERARLIEKRLARPAAERQQAAARVAARLNELIASDSGEIVSLYWPFRGELNLRPWMHQLVERGLIVALPAVVGKARPLNFHRWTPRSRLVPGVWNIPVPIDGELLDPTTVIAPLVGFDPDCYRLGYGGGFFDRTLAALQDRDLRPRVIGVGHTDLAIDTIYPQPHDVPMSAIVTESTTCRRASDTHS